VVGVFVRLRRKQDENLVIRFGSAEMYTLFVLAVGIFIGWNIPQPDWARDLQEKVMAKLRGR